jgi:tRNA synthetases class I (E and Q), catalytic domain
VSVRVRFAPSPTGSIHVANALSAVANRTFADEHGGALLLRIDDIDPARNVRGGEEAIVDDLEWLGVRADEGPVRQSDRGERYREAAAGIGPRFGRVTLLRDDGSATYHLASVVDDGDFGITHVIRAHDHRPDEELHRRLHEALGTRPPEYLHHGLVLGEDGKKLSERHGLSTLRDLREAGIPGEAVRRYLEELGLPRHAVRLDPRRIRRLAIEAITSMPDEELTERAGAPPELAAALRGARDLNEAREFARQILAPEPVTLPEEARPTVERFADLLGGDPRETIRELKAVGGDLHAVRLALTGRDRGPELWAVVHALPPEEALLRARRSLPA